MSGKRIKNRFSLLLLLGAAFVLASALVLLWTMVLREGARRQMLLEYEAFRASSAIVDEYRRDQSYDAEEHDRILGFGFYAYDGEAFLRHGSAPERIDIQGTLLQRRQDREGLGLPGSVSVEFDSAGKSLVLLRLSGFQNPARGMGSTLMTPGSRMQRGRAGSRTQSLPDQESDQPSAVVPFPLAAMSGNYLVWTEFSTDGLGADMLAFPLAASIISLILIALFIVLVFLYRHNEALRSREAQTRELVQLGEAARTLVHEIKNPLGIMRIQTAAIRRAASAQARVVPETPQDRDTGMTLPQTQTADSERIVRSSDLIEGEILRLSGLADRIREFLQPGKAKALRLDLKQYLDLYSSRYRDSAVAGAGIQAVLPEENEVLAMADQDKLTTALDNLLRNAMDAMEELPEKDRRITIRLFRRDSFWVIAVTDNGKGIAPEQSGRLFDPFFTTKEKGSGIGLALAKRLVESFGATLSYEGSDEGRGAVFSIRLPALKP
ncbi:MAG: ATP-binding protein [Spirochaetales bacterium]|nr:ATP-binding protein [Spirochaetales bacterium]